MRIIVLPGDGIGPEIMSAAMGVLTALNDANTLGLVFEYVTIGLDSLATHATTLRPKFPKRQVGLSPHRRIPKSIAITT